MSVLFDNLEIKRSQRVNFTAIILDEKSHNKLALLSPEGWKTYAHHMTIIGPVEQKGTSKISPESLGKKVELFATAIAKNDKVMTAKIDLRGQTLPMLGPAFPHVTIATNLENGGKPVMSNKFSDSDFVQITPIKLTGTIEEIIL
jgi:hypothetical protein